MNQCCIYILLQYLGALQDMTALDLVTTLVNQLDNMIAKFALSNLADFRGVCHSKSHIGKAGV